MAKKQVIEQFRGERPRLPNKDLPQSAASLAVNTRLSNGEIRAYPAVRDSLDDNSQLNDIVSGGYTNFFKASNEDAINWMSWVDNINVSVLEVRYNNIEAYEFPLPPSTNVREDLGEQLAVGFFGLFVANRGSGEVEDWRAAFTRGAQENSVSSGIQYPFDQMVSAVVVDQLDTITTYRWDYVSGDSDIVADDQDIQNPTFSTTLGYPYDFGLEAGFTKSAVWRATVTDASGNVGTKEVTISFTTYTFENSGGGGFPPQDDDFWDEF